MAPGSTRPIHRRRWRRWDHIIRPARGPQGPSSPPHGGATIDGHIPGGRRPHADRPGPGVSAAAGTAHPIVGGPYRIRGSRSARARGRRTQFGDRPHALRTRRRVRRDPGSFRSERSAARARAGGVRHRGVRVILRAAHRGLSADPAELLSITERSRYLSGLRLGLAGVVTFIVLHPIARRRSRSRPRPRPSSLSRSSSPRSSAEADEPRSRCCRGRCWWTASTWPP